MAMSTLVPAGLQPVERTLVPDPPLSDAEFEALCHAFDTVQFERTKEGVILMNPPAWRIHRRWQCADPASIGCLVGNSRARQSVRFQHRLLSSRQLDDEP